MQSLIALAADCGATGIKFQWCSDPEMLARRRDAADMLPYYQWLKFPLDWLADLRARATQRGLTFGCTAYLPRDVAAVDPYIDFYKIAAFEATAADLIAANVAQMRGNEKPLVVSLGLGAAATDLRVLLNDADISARTLRLRCVSAYPTPIGELGLAALHPGGDDPIDGLSDHTAADDPDSLNVGALAVAAGARWIERHVRLAECRESNPDHAVSFSAHPFAEYVHRIVVAEQATVRRTGAAPSEQPMERHKAKGPSDASSSRRSRRAE